MAAVASRRSTRLPRHEAVSLLALVARRLFAASSRHRRWIASPKWVSACRPSTSCLWTVLIIRILTAETKKTISSIRIIIRIIPSGIKPSALPIGPIGLPASIRIRVFRVALVLLGCRRSCEVRCRYERQTNDQYENPQHCDLG